jgi:SAM-dependent methyltransferase
VPFERSGGYFEVNKKHWDERAKSEYSKRSGLLKQIRSDYPYLEEVEPMIEPYLRHIEAKRIIVQQFGDGLVLLACAKKGAVVTGVDFSSEQVQLAKKEAEYCGVNVTLVEGDCQNLPKSVPRNYFDIAVAECGVFVWIKDLNAWMKNAHDVLRTGGKLVVSDFHPLDLITEEKKGRITFKRGYFDEEPTFCEHKDEGNLPPSIEFVWKISDVINAAIVAGFRIEHLEEFYVEQEGKKFPLIPEDFLIVAAKD